MILREMPRLFMITEDDLWSHQTYHATLIDGVTICIIEDMVMVSGAAGVLKFGMYNRRILEKLRQGLMAMKTNDVLYLHESG